MSETYETDETHEANAEDRTEAPQPAPEATGATAAPWSSTGSRARGPALFTLLYGLALVLVAVAVLAGVMTRARLDLGVAVPVAAVTGGVLLVAASVVSGLARRS